MNPIQIPMAPKPGEIWFYIDLNLVPTPQLPELFVLLEALGLTPKLAYRQLKQDLELCALLYQGTSPGMVSPPHELYAREQELLANLLEDPNAMHFLCGVNRKPTAIAANRKPE